MLEEVGMRSPKVIMFNCRGQKDNKSVADYIAELRKLFVHCNFGDQYPHRLRNRLVSGVRYNRTRNRLLSEGAALTWGRAVALATAANVQM